MAALLCTTLNLVLRNSAQREPRFGAVSEEFLWGPIHISKAVTVIGLI